MIESFNETVEKSIGRMHHECADVECMELCYEPKYFEFEIKNVFHQTKSGKNITTGISSRSTVVVLDDSPSPKRLRLRWEQGYVPEKGICGYRLNAVMFIQSDNKREWIQKAVFTSDWYCNDRISTVDLRSMLRTMWGNWAEPLFDTK